MASNQQQYNEQLQLLQQRFPEESNHKFLRLLHKYDGDVDQVRGYLVQQEFRKKKLDSLETRFGSALAALQPTSEPLKRACLLKLMERFDGDVNYVQKYLAACEQKRSDKTNDSNQSEDTYRKGLKLKYATQLAELSTAGINTHLPCVLKNLEKSQGDVNKVLKIMEVHSEKKDKLNELATKYENQIAQLEADGIKIKNKRYLIQLLEKANGQIDVVKQILAERNEQKHHVASSTEENKDNVSFSKNRQELNIDDVDTIKQLRSAGIHGNPVKILSVFHECNDSIDMTIARLEKEREQRKQQSEKRVQQRVVLAEIHDAYVTINNQDDWPKDIEQVYLDGNNMMFVIDSLRRLCLNRAGKKTERAIADIAAAWNEHMHIPNVDLIFDSTRQLDQVGSIKVSSAQPSYKTTDDMLIDIAQRTNNQHTIIVTSDRALAIQLKHEGCLLVKPYAWFAHCAMILTPDLIKHEDSKDMSTTKKTYYELDELARRIAKIDV
ncbi:unnamed protein product [Adineta steineri]|uniref:Uncharacterized protein n=1 Tax=Adineta steineri TaxID=433720 RepID=A0A819NCL5_9BILA|nr:unnamed protein product [Adineta steineri]CAF3993607.1 unnamed protein product [Adineta steineri]